MKVRELIAALAAFDPEADVHVEYPSGDYWRTQLAPPARAPREADVRHSEYHGKMALADDERDDDDAKTVVVIGG